MGRRGEKRERDEKRREGMAREPEEVFLVPLT